MMMIQIMLKMASACKQPMHEVVKGTHPEEVLEAAIS
jgi:hypothetical protein